MKLAPSKWLAYTFLVGLIPMLTRLLSWAVTSQGSLAPFATQDLVAFGLVLHASIINEIEHIQARDKDWKTIQNGTTILFVALYGALYTLSMIGEKISGLVDADYILYVSGLLAVGSALLCQATFHHLSR